VAAVSAACSWGIARGDTHLYTASRILFVEIVHSRNFLIARGGVTDKFEITR